MAQLFPHLEAKNVTFFSRSIPVFFSFKAAEFLAFFSSWQFHDIGTLITYIAACYMLHLDLRQAWWIQTINCQLVQID